MLRRLKTAAILSFDRETQVRLAGVGSQLQTQDSSSVQPQSYILISRLRKSHLCTKMLVNDGILFEERDLPLTYQRRIQKARPCRPDYHTWSR